MEVSYNKKMIEIHKIELDYSVGSGDCAAEGLSFGCVGGSHPIQSEKAVLFNMLFTYRK